MDISKLHDGDVREALVGLGAALSNSLPLLGTIKAVVRNVQGRIPSTDGGCHEVELENQNPTNPAAVSPSERRRLFSLLSKEDQIAQLREVVAKIEGRR